MPKRLRDKRLIVVFKAFFDESGTDPIKNKALVMAGFLGTVEEWERASDAWDICLHEHPAIEFFSHNEAAVLDGQFGTFNRTQADEKIRSLARVITQFELIGFCPWVPYLHFKERDPKASRKVIGSRIYDWAFGAATSLVLGYMKKSTPEGEKVDFIFDERTELRACINLFNEVKQNAYFAYLAPWAGICIPGDDKVLAALQMSDLLAWEVSNAIDTKVKNEPLQIIEATTKLTVKPISAPSHMESQFRIQKLDQEVHRETTEFLRWARSEQANDAEAAERIEYLKQRDTYLNVEFGRILLRMDADKELQAFERDYIASQNSEETGK